MPAIHGQARSGRQWRVRADRLRGAKQIFAPDVACAILKRFERTARHFNRRCVWIQSEEMTDAGWPLMGGCRCGRARYRLNDAPLIVHACHCRMCQRLTGSTNAVIERSKIDHLIGDLEHTEALTPSEHGQVVSRCSVCKVALWSEYRVMTAKTGADLHFVRAGTLDNPARVPPDVHIYTETRLAHASSDKTTPAFPTFYDLHQTWRPSSLKRLALARAERMSQQGV